MTISFIALLVHSEVPYLMYSQDLLIHALVDLSCCWRSDYTVQCSELYFCYVCLLLMCTLCFYYVAFIVTLPVICAGCFALRRKYGFCCVIALLRVMWLFFDVLC